MGDVITHARKTGQVLDMTKIEERVAICHKCLQFDPRYGKCNACGCFIKLKAPLTAARCPLLKWPGDN